jgi:uncharacterized protein YjbI with pentapeptide repeats
VKRRPRERSQSHSVQRPDSGVIANPAPEPGPPKLWKIRWAVTVATVTALAGLTGLTWLAWLLLHSPKLPRPGTISLHDTVGVLQLVFASVAGAGALVALVVAYRRQKVSESASELDRYRAGLDRTRVFNERFTTSAAQLGDDNPAICLAGVQAMAGLADDWEENRQTCIDVLCAYLRMPYKSDPGDQAPVEDQLRFRAFREVRHSLIRVVRHHLIDSAKVSWRGLNFDFTGVVFDGGYLAQVDFFGGSSNGYVSFEQAQFCGPVSFDGARFRGGTVSFTDAVFSSGDINFRGADFAGGLVSFRAQFSGSTVNFSGANFSGSQVDFRGADFSAGNVSFSYARFSGSDIDFIAAIFSGSKIEFTDAEFSSGKISFSSELDVELWERTGEVERATFSGSDFDFSGAGFKGTEVDFTDADFSSGRLDFMSVSDWSHPPDFSRNPPAMVQLPDEQRLRASQEKRIIL